MRDHGFVINQLLRNRLTVGQGALYKPDMVAARNSDDFTDWVEEVGITSEAQAAILLGKDVRTVRRYRAGDIALTRDTRLLMQAIADGYRPRPWSAERRSERG